MTKEEKEWLIVNRDHFFEANIPALEILDILVTAKVFITTREDYQTIKFETIPHRQIRQLLDFLPSKGSFAFQVFAQALEKRCPQVLKACTERPADIIEKFDESLRSHFKNIDQEELSPFSWLIEDPDCPPITIANYIRHLAVVGKSQADQMISERIASSTAERQRCEYLYSNAEKHDLVRLENIFEDLDSGRLSKCSINTATSNVASCPASKQSIWCCRFRTRRRRFLYQTREMAGWRLWRRRMRKNVQFIKTIQSIRSRAAVEKPI